jgi:hypothetical protein
MATEGHVEKQDMIEMVDVLEKRIRDWPHVFLLVDQQKQTGISPEARKVIPEIASWVPYRGTAIYGGSFAMRVVSEMLMKMINLVRGMDNPTVFPKLEAEARAFIDKRRKELAARSVTR